MCRTCMTATRTNSFDAREGRSGRHGRGGREAGGRRNKKTGGMKTVSGGRVKVACNIIYLLVVGCQSALAPWIYFKCKNESKIVSLTKYNLQSSMRLAVRIRARRSACAPHAPFKSGRRVARDIPFARGLVKTSICILWEFTSV